jgi:hypothetical protein
MANATNTAGFAHKKGATAAARKVLGKDAVAEAEFEVFEIEGGRWDWKAVERTKQQRRSSGKGSPFGKQSDQPVLDGMPIPGLAHPTDEEVKATEALLDSKAGTLGNNFTDGSELPSEPVTAGPTEELGAPLQDEPTNHRANAFGAAAFAALGNVTDRRTEANGTRKGQRASDKPAAERKARVPSEMANGVRKPSAGTTCRHVWDELTRLQAENNGVAPDSKQVKALAEQHKWNTNNASIEFYQWRKFNGISGRTKASAPAAKPIKAK